MMKPTLLKPEVKSYQEIDNFFHFRPNTALRIALRFGEYPLHRLTLHINAYEALVRENKIHELPMGGMIAALLRDADCLNPTVEEYLVACNVYRMDSSPGSWRDLVERIKRAIDRHRESLKND